MESEKVKEIKKALEHCGEKVTCQGCPEYNNEPVIDWFKCKKNLLQKTITLINELESENEILRKHNIGYHVANNYEAQEQLKEFVERLKEKATWSFIMCGDHKAGAKTVTLHDIDETLKEYTNENGKV